MDSLALLFGIPKPFPMDYQAFLSGFSNPFHMGSLALQKDLQISIRGPPKGGTGNGLY